MLFIEYLKKLNKNKDNHFINYFLMFSYIASFINQKKL